MVLFLRLWAEGWKSQVRLWNQAVDRLGPEAGGSWFDAFDALVETITRFGHRALVLGALASAGLEADEGVIAALVTSAAEGAGDEAILTAARLVPASKAVELAEVARTVGEGLRHLAPGAEALVLGHAPPAIRH